MALITPFRDEGATDEILAVAQRHYEGALKALDLLTEQMANGVEVSVADFQRAARDFRAATQTLFDERKRVETKQKRAAGIVGEFGLDFEDARDEVRRLLDHLRKPGSSE